MPSLPYHPFKIKSLKDLSLSAAYLTVMLEEKEDIDLFEGALKDVFEALGEPNMTPEEAKLQLEKLDEIFSQKGSDVIYHLS